MPRLPDPRTSDSIDIDAPVDVVWSVYSDVARWPEWTDSVTSVELSPQGPLAIGSKARIKQPRLPNVEWTVTTFEPGREWVWENRSPGATSVAAHSVRADGDARTHVELWIDQRGFVGRAVGLLVRRTTRRYLRMEAEGLKRRCESAAEGVQGRELHNGD
jgi:uncharacterized membrane protein